MPTRPAYLRLRAELIQVIGARLARYSLTGREAAASAPMTALPLFQFEALRHLLRQNLM